MDGTCQIAISEEPERCELRLAGMFGVAEAEDLWRIARELSGKNKCVAVNWGGVTQFDTSTVQVFLCLRRALEERGKSLVHASIPPVVHKWLEMAGLLELEGVASL